MVYIDYEIGSSTRIDQLRRGNLGRFNTGLYVISLTSIGMTYFSYQYFNKLFNGSKLRSIGAVYLATQIGYNYFKLGIINVDPELNYFKPEIYSTMNEIQNSDIEYTQKRNNMMKEKIIENMGKL